MKTRQKTIWINYLTIGISAIFLYSCDTITEYKSITTYVYKNATSEDIRFLLYAEDGSLIKSFTIEQNKDLYLISEGEGSKAGIDFPFQNIMPSVRNITINFVKSNKCLINYQNILDPRLYDNFSKEMYNASNNTLIYNIDKEELDVATPCQ